MRYRETQTMRRSAILAAAIAWGTMGFAKSFLPAGTSQPAAGAVRLLGGAAILLAVYPRAGDTRAVLRDPGMRSWMLVGGIAMALSQALYFSAMTSAGVAIGATATLGTVPLFSGLYVALSERRRPARRWVFSTALALCGGVALAWGGPTGNHLAIGVSEGVAAGLAYTIFTEACARQVRHGGRPAVVMAFTLGIAGVLLSPVLMLTSPAWLGTGGGLAIAAYLAVVTTTGTYVAYGWGLRTTSLSTVATLLLAEPATAAVLGILVLHEPHTGWTWCGLALIGIALFTLTRAGSGVDTAKAAPPSPAPSDANQDRTVPHRTGPHRAGPHRAGPHRTVRHTVTVVVTRRGDRFVARCLDPDLARSGRSLAQSLNHLRTAVEHHLAGQPWAEAPHPLVTSLEVQIATYPGRRPGGPVRRGGSGTTRYRSAATRRSRRQPSCSCTQLR